MHQVESEFDDVAWYRAATLSERIAAACASRDTFHAAEGDGGTAARRLLRWHSQAPFGNELLRARWLALAGISQEQVRTLLGEPLTSLRARIGEAPPWLAELSAAFRDGRAAGPIALQGSDPAAGFLNAIEPIITQAVTRFRERARELSQRFTDPPFHAADLETTLLDGLQRQLLAMSSRTLVLELAVARVEGLLDGESPEDRFRSFVDRLRRDDVRLGILREYPVLARQRVARAGRWVGVTLELLERLCADRELIQSTFSPDDEIGLLVRLHPGAGDRHRDGRSVVIADFSSGLRVVYKPRSVLADLHFQELVEWFNRRGLAPDLRTIRVVDRGTHGWLEFVAPGGCRTEAAVSEFYRRQGAYLMLFHLVAASDFHCENLIAAGEHPVPVDLEAIFHARLPAGGGEWNAAGARTIEDSVLAVGLLPQRLRAQARAPGADVSGLGGAAGQVLPYRAAAWERAGTDEMRFARQQATTVAAGNRPSLGGADANPCDHAHEIVEGFTRAYRLVSKHRGELLSPAGPLSRFAYDEVRAILRPTQTYAVLLEESFHPDVLRDSLDRDLLLDRLWVAVEALPHLARVISAERHDLHNGDIPIFTARPAARTLWTSSGRAIDDFFDEPALSRVRERLDGLGERDLKLQTWFIRASMAASPEYRPELHARVPQPIVARGTVGREELLAAARGVGDELARLSIRWKDETSWIGLVQDGDDRCSISPVGIDLYDGLSGIALFLGHLGAVAREQRFTSLARQACETILGRIARGRTFIDSIGAHGGWGGVIYALAHLGALWGEPALLDEAEALVATLPTLVEKDENLDVIGGSAGCIAGLLSLHRQRTSRSVLDVAVRCAERLIGVAQPQRQGRGWIVAGQPTPLTGFAHGAAGIAWALLRLAAVRPDGRFRTAALDGIDYERSLFSPEARNWPDLRVSAGPDSYATTWCHGAPGIGLARLSTLEDLDDRATLDEIDAALTTTLGQGFGQNHSLCHGDLGNAELVLQAARILDDSRWQGEVSRVSGNIVESLAQYGFLCGTPARVSTPGLMTGLAGIGYELLRLAEPDRVPSALLLEPPLEG